MTALIEEVRHGRREKLPDADTNCMEKSNSEKDDDEAIDCLENSMHIDPNLQNPSGDACTDLNSLQIELNLNSVPRCSTKKESSEVVCSSAPKHTMDLIHSPTDVGHDEEEFT